MRRTGDKGEGRIMVEESALLVIGMKALNLKSFGFYSQENKCNVNRKWLQSSITPHPLQLQALFCFLRLSLSGLRAGRRISGHHVGGSEGKKVRLKVKLLSFKKIAPDSPRLTTVIFPHRSIPHKCQSNGPECQAQVQARGPRKAGE